jgi:hypothetical protein
VCRGFSIKRLQFDGDGKLVMSRVNRQLTKEEQQRLLAPATPGVYWGGGAAGAREQAVRVAAR